ncbi:hypothetical protein BDF22DRAFT_735844 [Syncephalis plumigaleata]|nr:hypothetical protein BDF22DRAFT_735844 [Syncephalis plumigaleata]
MYKRMHWISLIIGATLLFTTAETTSIPGQPAQRSSSSSSLSSSGSLSRTASLPHSPGSLSFTPLAQTIYNEVMKVVAERPESSTVPKEHVATSGGIVKTSMNYSPMDRICEDLYFDTIMKAKEEVLLQTYFYDPNSRCGHVIQAALKQLNMRVPMNGQPIKIKITFDSTTLFTYAFSLAKKYVTLSLPFYRQMDPRVIKLDPQNYQNLELEVFHYHIAPMGSIHSKNIVVDGIWSCIGSKNIDEEPALEMGIQMYGDIAKAMRADFYQLLQLKPDNLSRHLQPTPPPSSLKIVPMIVAGRTARSGFTLRLHSITSPQSAVWLTALENASKEVFILTPNFNMPIMRKAVVKALERDIIVHIILSKGMLDNGQKAYIVRGADGTNDDAANLLMRDVNANPKVKGILNIRWVTAPQENTHPGSNQKPGNSSHAKLMIIDNRLMFAGSGNWDLQSGYYSQEFNILFDDKEATRAMSNKLEQVVYT